MTALDWNTVTIMATIFSVGGMSAFWIESRFRRSEKIFADRMNAHEKEDRELFEDHAIRIQRVELNAFGFTKTP